jgi:Domain of unknown function (DUF6946)
MSRLCIETRGIASWRDRLASPDTQWERKFSAFETAVSWEGASRSESGLPQPIVSLFDKTVFGVPKLLLAVAEHKVPLRGRGGDSQCDVWALLHSEFGGISLSVEAKAKEPFGQGNESLQQWLDGGKTKEAKDNRCERWSHVAENLPKLTSEGYVQVPFQLLHRCAAAVIEARRFGLKNAAFIVQSFDPQSFGESSLNFDAFSRFCREVNLKAERGQMQIAAVQEIRLGIGWADCPFAGDADVASVA